MAKELARTRYNAYVVAGDTFRLSYTDETGVTKEVLSREITAAMEIDTAIVFEVEPGDFGLESGLGGVFGKEKT